MVEAPDPHGMVPSSTPYIYKEFEFETIQCCGRADGSTITPLAPYLYAKYRELADLLGHSEDTNDVKVQ